MQQDPRGCGSEPSSGILSFVLFWSAPPPFSSPPQPFTSSPSSSPLASLPRPPPPPPFCVSVCLMSFVSLSGSSQTLRHLLLTDRQTDLLEITSQWRRLGGVGSRVVGCCGGEKRQMYRQTELQQRGDGSASHVNHRLLAGGVQGSAWQVGSKWGGSYQVFWSSSISFENVSGLSSRWMEQSVHSLYHSTCSRNCLPTEACVRRYSLYHWQKHPVFIIK